MKARLGRAARLSQILERKGDGTPRSSTSKKRKIASLSEPRADQSLAINGRMFFRSETNKIVVWHFIGTSLGHWGRRETISRPIGI